MLFPTYILIKIPNQIRDKRKHMFAKRTFTLTFTRTATQKPQEQQKE
jgi:hypothetical protein